MNRRIRVLVADDSLTLRKHIVEVLSGDPELEVAGEAVDGRKAIELCEALRPDVVTMDMMMPELTGVAATEYIMAFCPTPILIVSSSLNRGEVFRTFDALAAGAVDVLEKPSGIELDEEWGERLRRTVKLCARIKVIRHLRGCLAARAISSPARERAAAGERPPRLVAIGASTGGPGAVLEILKGLPRGFPLPVLVVLHLNEVFGFAFVDWLDAHGPFRVRHPKDGDLIPPRGQPAVLVAPPGLHMEVEGELIRIRGGPQRHFCRPSVDVLFESLARQPYASEVVACLLTGMGRDGAQGMLVLRNAGARTFAQDEPTSTIFGMPKEAIALGAAERVLPLGEFAPALGELATAL